MKGVLLLRSGGEARYRPHDFAALAGVTVRTLHHYDRLGLLKAQRSDRGYRLYRGQDLERLEQIAALKFLGLSLAQIRLVLDGKQVLLQDELARQRRALREKRRVLEQAMRAIQEAEAAVQRGEPVEGLLRRIIQTIQMQNKTEWMKQYYSAEAQAKLDERAAHFTSEMQEKISEDWQQYYRDLEALKETPDPEGKKAAELAERHKKLVAAFTGNDPDIEAGLAALYRDRENWPADMKQRMSEYERGRSEG